MAEEATEEKVETPEETTKEEETPNTPEEEEKETETETEEEAEDKKEETKEDEKKDKSKRTPRLMEVYKHKIAEKNWGKDKKVLEEKVGDLTRQLETMASPDRAKAIKDFAEQSGMDEAIVKGFLKIAEMGQTGFKKEIDALKTEIKESSEKSAWVNEEAAFDKDYEKTILPILEADGIPKENISRLRKLLHKLAFTEEYAKTPLPVIYRGVEDFKQFSEKGKKSGEHSRGGIRGKEEKVSILDMTPEEYEKYIKEEKAKESGVEIRRDGRTIKD